MDNAHEIIEEQRDLVLWKPISMKSFDTVQ